MRISDWSSDVCSSDLLRRLDNQRRRADVDPRDRFALRAANRLRRDLDADVHAIGDQIDYRYRKPEIGAAARDIDPHRLRADQRVAAALIGLELEIDGRVGAEARQAGRATIGRVSFRERVCQYVSNWVVAVSLTKKKKKE